MIQTDFLVIGSGIAGLSYALKVAEHYPEKKVLVITKSRADETNTKYAQGGIAGVTDFEHDSYDKHIQDTLVAGDGLCNPHTVEIVVTEGPERIKEIIEWGTRFDKDPEGDFKLGKEGGHSEFRILHHKDVTGKEIERALLETVGRQKNIEIIKHWFVLDLITQHHLGYLVTKSTPDIECYGVYALDQHTNKIVQILSKITLLATGGNGQAYRTTTNPTIATGDGVAMVYRAKGRIENMEFIQFHPTALFEPGISPSFLITEAVRGDGGILRNNRDEAFMEKYDARKDLAPRDIVARAIDSEMKRAGTEHVYLDCRHMDKAKLMEHFPNIYEKCRSIGIDIATQLIPVAPAAHYSCGGIKVDEWGRTSIAHLYACGECSSTGLHGANRLASNSLLEALVFSHRCYLESVQEVQHVTFRQNIPEWNAEGTTLPDEMILITQSLKELQLLMSDYVGIVRTHTRLQRASKRLDLLHEEIESLYETTAVSPQLCEVRNLITVGYLIVKEAQFRKESRGLHYNTDYPVKSPLVQNIVLFLLLLLSLPFSAHSQSAYPSLLWEISGNGLQKPSYLFGSMHISNKEVFHLSDSFYKAIKSCDVVALEVDPKEWEPDMFRLQEAEQAHATYSFGNSDRYLGEADFRLKGYGDALKAALREEPFVLNGLLYRTTAPMANFQEDTYLDLYIYQTGRRLGKIGTGVENYLQSERISIEANQAVLSEKRQRKVFPEGENSFTIASKMQEAYRRGDLSLMDSLDQLLSVSKVYTEKFLYHRNDIQANAIDSIIRHASLFVAVGAAHLPGSRGVIESLRRKGYTLRPVKMTDQDASDREQIDRLHVPVESHTVVTDDGFIGCRLPGQWYRREEAAFNSSWQYADMANGSYYLLTRVKTHSALTGQSSAVVMAVIDSLLYDNIPGKILRKQEIKRNGYSGLEIVNKTRNGDVQRYMILVTPFEIIVFKMSGNEDYVSGKEGDDFIASIQLKEPVDQWVDYTPSSGGFRASFPATPAVSFADIGGGSFTGFNGGFPGGYIWQYEAVTATGESYLILKKNLTNTRFLEEDTLDLSLIGQSLKGSGMIARELSRKFGQLDGHDCLDMEFSTTTGGRLKAKAVIRGPEYYLLLAAAKKEAVDFPRFFDSFRLLPYQYPPPEWYTDTTRHFSVRTPIYPRVPEELRPLTEAGTGFTPPSVANKSYVAETKSQHAYFYDDSTGENIHVTVSTLPDYFYPRDSGTFWDNEMHWNRLKAEFILDKKEYFSDGDSVGGYRYTLLDTNTNREILGLAMVKGNTLYRLTAVTDRLGAESPFISTFFSSFTPLAASNGYALFTSKSALFFGRYRSDDSLERRIAHEALSHIIFKPGDLPEIQRSVRLLKPDDKNYIETKSHFISSLGRIRDSCCPGPVIAYLSQVYEQSIDTGAFQNAALEAMVRLHNKDAYALVKKWLIQSPPVFENATQLRELFGHIGEDSVLAISLFPEVLQLIPVEGYKAPVLQLMAGMSDSGRLPATAYDGYFTGLFSDAQLLLKKQQLTEEKNNEDDDDNNSLQPPHLTGLFSQDESFGSVTRELRSSAPRLDRYAAWLVPFYDRPGVARWFSQLLRTRSLAVKQETALVLIRNNRPVPDSLLHSLAADDWHRAKVYEELLKAGKSDLFPATFKTQEAMARSVLSDRRPEGRESEIQLVGKQRVITKRATGYVYFFKYKEKGQEGWMMAISGIQPDKSGEVNTHTDMVEWTGLPLNGGPELQQFQAKLPQWILSRRESALRFFRSNSGLNRMFMGD